MLHALGRWLVRRFAPPPKRFYIVTNKALGHSRMVWAESPAIAEKKAGLMDIEQGLSGNG